MENSVCGSGNPPTDTENSYLNEATPAVIPVPDLGLPKDASSMLTNPVECDDAISSTTPDKFAEELENATSSIMNIERPTMSSETDADFFSSELSISDVPAEKITENVEDIVQDLENLLGESNDSYRFSRESFDNSKLADSYGEVNSSNVADLFVIEPTNLDEPAFHCNILPNVSGNIESELRKTEINKPLQLEVTDSIEEVNAVSNIDSELKNIVSESVVESDLETPEEANTFISVNSLMESQTEAEKTNNDVASKSETIQQPIANEDLIKTETFQQGDAVLKPEMESVVNTDLSTENTKICTNSEAVEICKYSDIKEQGTCSVSEIVTVCEQPVEDATELLEELIKDTNSANIDSGCLENLLDDINNEAVLQEANVEEKGQCSMEEENIDNIQESKMDLDEQIDDKSVNQILIEDLALEHILPSNVEDEMEKGAEALSRTITEDCEQNQTTGGTIENNENSNVIIEMFQKTAADVSEGGILPDVEVSRDQAAKVQEQEITESPHKPINEQNITASSSTDLNEVVSHNQGAEVQEQEIAPINEQNIIASSSTDLNEEVTYDQGAEVQEQEIAPINKQNITASSSTDLNEDGVSSRTTSTKLVQPLTVEVEDSDFNERQQTEITRQEQTAEKNTSSKEIQKFEVLQAHDDVKQTSLVDTDINQTNRAPLKMTITKHKSDNVHSILKIYDPNDIEPNQEQHIPKLIIKSTPTSTTGDDPEQAEEQVIPKITFKSISASTETQHSPRLTIKPIKLPITNQEISDKQNSPKTTKPGSPRITIKPVVKPESLSPLKLTLRPYPKLEEVPSSSKLNIKPVMKPSEESISSETHHSPKITIKPILKPPAEIESCSEEKHSPRVTIKPVLKPPEELAKGEVYLEQRHSPRITIKPVIKPPEESIKKEEEQHSPRITIKPLVKPPDESNKKEEEQHSPRITIKPVIKPPEESNKKEEEQHSPRITIKPVLKPPEESNKKEEEQHSPRITIKPVIKPPEESNKKEEEQHNPRITIKPVLKPQEETFRDEPKEEKHSPRITIKPIVKPNDECINQDASSYSEERHSPKVAIKPAKKSPEEIIKEESESCTDDRQNPRITIKPIIKQADDLPKEDIQNYTEERHNPRITIKPVIKPPEETAKEEVQICSEERPSPRIIIKPVIKPPEESVKEELQQSYSEEKHSPRITIKPIIKPPEEVIKEEVQSYSEERHSPRITIKPVIKPLESETENSHSPRVTIKPVIKPQEDSKQIDDMSVLSVQPFKLNIKPIVKPPECSPNPKVTIKPVPKPVEPDNEPIELIDFEDQIKQERIVLKIAKNTKKERESLKKRKVKLSKERGLACIVPTAREGLKRSSTEDAEQEFKLFKSELPSDLTISLVSKTASTTNMTDVTITRIDSTLTDTQQFKQEESGSSSDAQTVLKQSEEPRSSFFPGEEIPDPLADIPVFEITLESAAAMSSAPSRPTTAPVPAVAGTPPAPRKRGRPRKVPLEVREEFKDIKEEETFPPVVEESTRPKRSCRGASVKATLGIKPRKPRAPSTRGRGGKKTVSTRATTKKTKERKPSSSKLKLLKELMIKEELELKEFETKDAEFKQVPLPTESANREVVIYEEETRMSAENTSRAQTPAKQVLTSSTEVVEESQSSVQSNTTTESGEKTQKVRKGPRLEVHQEPEGEVISADKLAEYSWGGGGPYMLQEQVAQFLGIKSFKRKYPGIQRRPVDMQERDFIRESCLASEAMCDMGLTAVRSEDILDIMYTDFQHKYEEYCKHQRDRQAKDVSNKQKALSLAASQEKNKLDIVEQAVQSAFQWNANFNKARREQRRACMDLQTFTVHFPKGKMKQVNKPSIGHYPLALVPGQYTDYYKKYNSLELGILPLNTIGCKTVSVSSINQDTEESQSDGSGSDSDSSSSDSDSSDSSSGAEDCKMCTPTAPAHASKKMLVH